MKNLMAKIKTLDYKQFALQHGEKIGLGVVGLIALVCLGMTNWASTYTGTPDSMEKKAEDMSRNLTANRWPEAAKAEFLPLVEAENELSRVVADVDLKKYEWSVEMSKKLYQAQVPAIEPEWTPVTELYAFTGKMPMAVAAPMSSVDEPAEEPEAKKPAKGKKGSKKNDADDLLKGPMSSMMMPGAPAGGGFGAASSEKARGVRFNVVVGIVNAQQQYKQLRTALHLDFIHQAKSHLVYTDFKIQRQRAVPGPDPWTGPWKDVSTDTSIDVLMNEASDFDPELVNLNYTNVAFTSPLPHRLDDDWDSKLVVHPKIPTLTEDELEKQDQEIRAISEVAAGDEDAAGSGKRSSGFRKVQKDAGRMRDSVMSREGGMKEVESIQRKNSSGRAGASMDSRSMMQGGAGGRMGPPGGMMGGNVMGYGPGAGASEGGADLLLFRYFDFDVEPGECYRYRVQLVVENPSYGQDFVASSSVAEGEFRETPWSSPSTAIAVEKDVDYALVKVPERGGIATGAELNVVQFDPNVGTFISDTFPVKYGAYVGAIKKSLHLELAPPDLKEEEVTFSSKDVMLDSARAPNLSASAAADLKLSDKQKRELSKNGDLDLAVTLNRFGEIVDLDGGSKQDIKPVLDKVKEEREPYNEIQTDRKKKTKDAKEAEKEGKKGKGRRGRSRGGKNPLKANSGSMMMSSPGGAAGFGSGSAMPGMGPGGAGKAR